jgi:hypothetical protein
MAGFKSVTVMHHWGQDSSYVSHGVPRCNMQPLLCAEPQHRDGPTGADL